MTMVYESSVNWSLQKAS